MAKNCSSIPHTCILCWQVADTSKHFIMVNTHSSGKATQPASDTGPGPRSPRIDKKPDQDNDPGSGVDNDGPSPLSPEAALTAPPIAQYYTLAEPDIDIVPSIDVSKYPTPAIDIKLKRWDDSKCWVLGMDTSWNQENLAKIDGFTPPRWWKHDFKPVYKVKEHSADDSNHKFLSGAKAVFEKLNMAGLTIVQGLSPELKGDSSQQCGVLGFTDGATMNTFLDTQGTSISHVIRGRKWVRVCRVGTPTDVLSIAADFLGPLNRFMVHTTTRANGNNLTNVFHSLADMKDHRYGDSILDGIARVASCRSWLVRDGDVGLHDSPGSTNYNMTVLANVCMLLKFARVASEDTAEARYEQKFGDNGGDVDGRLYGFTVDDWFRGVYMLLLFRYRRSARLHLDTPKGQFTVRAEHVGYWQANVAESRSLLSADEHSKVPENAFALYGMELYKFVRSDPPASECRPVIEDPGKKLMNLVNTRINILLRDNPSVSLSYKRARTGRRSGDAANKMGEQLRQLPPMDSKVLDVLLTKLACNFLVPAASRIAEDVIQHFGGLTAKDQIQDFVASQDAFMSEVAHIEARHSGLGTEQALVDVRKLVENTAAISNMASRHVNPDVDMVAAAWAVGIDASDPTFDWTKIHIPDTAHDFFVMPHQLADAYAMLLAEESPVPSTILGNDVGLGKTVTALLLVLMSYYKWKRRKEAGEPVDAWPTIFFEPPNLVAQVFNEITSFFGQLFTVVVVQGHPSSHGNNSRLAEASQRGRELRDLMGRWKSQKDDPKASQPRISGGEHA